MPDRIGKFDILRALGHGAMGEVYLAMDSVIGRQVALKVIRPALAGLDPGGELKTRFQREAKAAGILSHPHIVTVYEFGEEQGLLFLAMEFVDGEDFAGLLAERALSPAQTLEAVAQICEGLQQAHKAGILHRDIKPSNVMVTREDGELNAKLMDFGVAKATGAAATQTGQVVGTLAYMAPEYLRTGEASPLTDLFSVGVMLHEALAGERPFGGSTTGAVVYGIMNDPPRRLDPARFEGLSPAVADLVAGLLNKDPAQRLPGSAGELARWLRAAKDPAWRLPEDALATTALSRQAAADLADRATTTAGRRVAEDAITTGGHRVPARRGIPWIIAGGALLLAGAAFLMLRKSGEIKVVAPTTTNMHVNDVALEEAAKIAAKGHPEDAQKLAQAVIDATPKDMPVDPDAYAVKLVCLYQRDRVIAFGETLTESRFRGASAKDLLTNAAYKEMLEKDKVKKKLPEKLRERLLAGREHGDTGDADGTNGP
ncbi:MAG TPA: serine/threonine-protein kinase [Holophagaceae bacterium]|nr:serine/threonine-protein kinase [Holophagaceae bacterium]